MRGLSLVELAGFDNSAADIMLPRYCWVYTCWHIQHGHHII